MTSTLQQEGGRKLRLSSSQVMRVAQGLYERGYITYMRTDTVVLSDDAMQAVRAAISSEYGQQFLSPAPSQYTSKAKNAQEAHEAIRPATPLRSPRQVSSELNSQELALYRLIWQRTLASQMADAVGTTVTVRLGATAADGSDTEFGASGTTITFPGYRQVYVESRDEGDGDGAEREALLPPLAVGDAVAVAGLEPRGHATSPPARYTEASLVKRLDELEIGRPSTWASIIQTVQDRGYVWKKGQALVPTWTAFAVVGLLEQHFADLVDYDFTAQLETGLDAIANGDRQKDQWLQSFYFGDDVLPGLKRLVEENLDEIDAAAINTFPLGLDADGHEVVVKPGKYGPYVKRGEDTASVPEDLTPDELTLDKAIELLAAPKSDEPIGELDGLPVFAKNGRYGPYVQWGTSDAHPPGFDKPKMASLFKTMILERITMDEAEALLTLPRTLGIDPADGGDDPRQQRPVRAVRPEGQGLPQPGERGPAVHRHARRCAAHLLPAQGVPPGRAEHGGQGPVARVRHRPRQRAAGRRQGRQVRRVRDRRRDERLDRQGRPHRGHAPRAGLRAVVDPPGDRRRQGRVAGQADRPGTGAQVGGQEVDGRRSQRPRSRQHRRRRRRRPRRRSRLPSSPDPMTRPGPTRPLYVALEGPEGCGKSTQAELLATSLGAVLTRETGGTTIGRRLREILHDTTVTDLEDRAEALIAAADRAQHIAQVVRPALAAGRPVVSDRSVHSTLAYQGYGRGLDLDELRHINDWAIAGLWPTRVILLDAPTGRPGRAPPGSRPRPLRDGRRRVPRPGADRVPGDGRRRSAALDGGRRHRRRRCRGRPDPRRRRERVAP